jgi:formylglycine-generating enzyme required for sulfatase activity
VQNGYTIDSPYFTTEVGEFENSESPYGTFDQGGNALEWNESVGTPGSYRVTRGGSWIDDSSHLLSSFRNAVGGNPAAGNSYIGFRVAYVPEPSSMMSLLGLSVIGLVAHCWRRNKTV